MQRERGIPRFARNEGVRAFPKSHSFFRALPQFTKFGRNEIMSENPRRDLLKKAAALGIGAMASGSGASARASRVPAQTNQKPADTDFFPGFKKLSRKTSGATINCITTAS